MKQTIHEQLVQIRFGNLFTFLFIVLCR